MLGAFLQSLDISIHQRGAAKHAVPLGARVDQITWVVTSYLEAMAGCCR
jgi:hypothetical protein